MQGWAHFEEGIRNQGGIDGRLSPPSRFPTTSQSLEKEGGREKKKKKKRPVINNHFSQNPKRKTYASQPASAAHANEMIM